MLDITAQTATINDPNGRPQHLVEKGLPIRELF